MIIIYLTGCLILAIMLILTNMYSKTEMSKSFIFWTSIFSWVGVGWYVMMYRTIIMIGIPFEKESEL